MVIYHITRSNSIEECSLSVCAISKSLHFESLYEAISALDERLSTDGYTINSSNKEIIKKYRGEINYNCGMTDHYESIRVLRERALIKLLGEGEHIAAFFVDNGNDDLQIQEILDNGVMIVYSYTDNRKITTFTPHPDRIISLYTAVGKFPPESLLEQSEYNIRRGYNEIHC